MVNCNSSRRNLCLSPLLNEFLLVFCENEAVDYSGFGRDYEANKEGVNAELDLQKCQ